MPTALELSLFGVDDMVQTGEQMIIVGSRNSQRIADFDIGTKANGIHLQKLCLVCVGRGNIPPVRLLEVESVELKASALQNQ